MPFSTSKFLNISFGSYNINGQEFKFQTLTIDEFEALQDKEAEMQDLQGKETTAKEALKLERDWNKYILQTAFGKKVKVTDIKNACKTVNKYNTVIAEVLIFLVRFSGMDGLRDFITVSTVNKDSMKTKSD